MKVEDKLLSKVIGGEGLAATFIKYFEDALKTIYSIGQDLGGAIKRIALGKTCSL